MIIDRNGHFTTTPPQLAELRTRQVAVQPHFNAVATHCINGDICGCAAQEHTNSQET